MRTWPAGHFGTYLGCTPLRPYEVPEIECLYKLHEGRHRDAWRLDGSHCSPALLDMDESWHEWQQRMIDIEFEASFLTECAIYFHMPGLRERVFRHPIWIDRYLSGKFRKRGVSEEDLLRQAYDHRVRILQGERSYNDWIEDQVGGYYFTNMRWVEMWGRQKVGYGAHADERAYRCVERQLLHANDPEAHVAWLRAVTPTREELIRLGLGPQYQVPMGLLAKRFEQEVFQPYLERYSNDVFFT